MYDNLFSSVMNASLFCVAALACMALAAASPLTNELVRIPSQYIINIAI